MEVILKIYVNKKMREIVNKDDNILKSKAQPIILTTLKIDLRQTDMLLDRHIIRKMNIQIDRLIYCETNRQVDRQTDRQTYR